MLYCDHMIRIIQNKIINLLLWNILIVYLFWQIFISVIVLNPMGLLPISLAAINIILLQVNSPHLRLALQMWALYLLLSSGLKLFGAYMQSIGAITYDWSTWGMLRSVLFIGIAAFAYYISLYSIRGGKRS